MSGWELREGRGIREERRGWGGKGIVGQLWQMTLTSVGGQQEGVACQRQVVCWRVREREGPEGERERVGVREEERKGKYGGVSYMYQPSDFTTLLHLLRPQ